MAVFAFRGRYSRYYYLRFIALCLFSICFLVSLFKKSVVNQLIQHNFLGTIANAIHDTKNQDVHEISSYEDACSGLFLHCQKEGCETLEDITEDMVLSYFCDESGRPALSSSTKVNIASVFHADLGMYTNAARTILAYLPVLNRKRKNIQYLTEEEMSSVKDVLMSEKSNITLRDRAIGMLLFFTGMRSSDIAGLTFSDIDWEKEEISIFQKKTGNELVLPLTASIGNALYDYVAMERPQSDSKKIEPLKQYDKAAETIRPDRTYFFETPNGKYYSRQWVTQTFQCLWKKANGKQNKAVAYDLRHNYAATNIDRWAGDTFEFDQKLHYLSKSMGHRSIESTLYYYSTDL